MDIFIYFIFSFAVYIQICEGLYGCNESIPTISYVESCPKNKTEWNIAARRKNCNSLAALQKCTKPEDFQYHCLENQWQTMTLEICAPIFYLQGYCARYSTDKKRVEENYDSGFECLKFDESERCPTRYPSTDAYKYQRCYKLKYQKPTQTACPICTSPSSQSETTPIVKKEDLRNDTDDSIKTVFLVILALALAGVIAFFILFYKRKSPNLERFFKVLTCGGSDDGTDCEGSDDGTDCEGSDDGTENEENRPLEEHIFICSSEANESSRLLINETGRDEEAPNESTISEPISGNNPFEEDTPPSVPISNAGIVVSHSSSIDDVPSSTPIVGDDPEKLNSDKDIVSNAKSKQEPVGDKPMPNNEAASIRKSDTLLNSSSNLDTERFIKAKSDNNSLSKPKSIDFSLPQVKSDTKNTSKPSESENDPTEISIPANNKTEDKSRDAYEEKFNEYTTKSNNGQSLKPVSNNNISSKSTSLEAPDSREVSNEKSAADPVTASHTSSSSVSPFESNKEDTKKVVIDDPKTIPTAAAKSTPKDVPTSDGAPALTLATDISTPGNNGSSEPMSENNPFDEDTTISDLSNDNPAPDSCALKPMSAINPFDEDSTPSATSEKDPAPNDSTNLKPISGNNPFEEDTPPSDAGSNIAPNDNNASNQNSGSNPFDKDITISEFGKRKPPRPPPHITKIDVPQNASSGKWRRPPPPPGQPRKS